MGSIDFNRGRTRRRFLSRAISVAASASIAGSVLFADEQSKRQAQHNGDDEILGQGPFRYRAIRHWGLLDRHRYPVEDCHGITEDRQGRIVALTNDTHNNLIAYGKRGIFIQAWENRFPAAHGLEITGHNNDDQYWITDHDRQVVSMLTGDGHEVRRLDPDALKSKYPDIGKYHPTNTAIMPDGDFFVSDGYGSSFVHHFDPQWRYISSFGGVGDGPENLNCPHAVWIDTRSGKPLLLVCDRGHNLLKWFSPQGELLKVVSLAEGYGKDEVGPGPSNVAKFVGNRFNDHIAVACLGGMILILDGSDRVVSAVGGEPPKYSDGKLQKLEIFNYTFNHPHDVYVDATGALYVVQWWSNQTYPIKLELLNGTD